MKSVIITLLSLLTITAWAADCHPTFNSKMPQYIIGYGSLMNKASKLRTDKTAGASLPVKVRGFYRGWLIHGCGRQASLSATFLGVKEKTGSKITAAIYPLNTAKNIIKYDRREKKYCRDAVALSQIQFLSHRHIKAGQYWIYIPSTHLLKQATKHCPIVQSYVDLFMDGCLALQKQYHLKHFARDCVVTTHDWPIYWINDRIYPRRPFIYEPNASKIDKLLKQQLPVQFSDINVQ